MTLPQQLKLRNVDETTAFVPQNERSPSTMLSYRAARDACRSKIIFGFVSSSVLPQSVSAEMSVYVCSFRGVCRHLWAILRTHFRSPLTRNATDLIYDLNKLLFLRAIITSGSKIFFSKSSHFNSDSVHTSCEMTVLAMERHGAGIKATDQLSTVTTRTQLQRMHIRSQSLRVVFSPPPPWFHDFTNRHRHRKRENTQCKHVWGVKPLNLTASHLVSLMSSEEVLIFRLIMLMNTLINSCKSIKRGSLVSESDPLTEEETGGKRERGRHYAETKLMNPAEVKAVSHINTCK